MLCNEHQTSLLARDDPPEMPPREGRGAQVLARANRTRAKNDDGSKLARSARCRDKIAGQGEGRAEVSPVREEGADSTCTKRRRKKGSMRGAFDKARASLTCHPTNNKNIR